MIGAVLAKPGFTMKEDHKSLMDILSSFSSLFVSREFGGETFSILENKVDLPSVSEIGYKQRFDVLVSCFVKYGVDVVVTVGGDGIASYVASALIKRKCDIPILGYPAGTANIGPIVRYGLTRNSLFHRKRIDTIEVSSKGEVLGYGFNDLIIANSFLGTLDGEIVNLDAAAMIENGSCIKVDPRTDIALPSFSLKVNSHELFPLDGWRDIAQICVSTLWQDDFKGRAIFGGILSSSCYSHPASIAVCNRIIVDSRPEAWNFKGITNTSHVAFGEEDIVEIAGLSDSAYAIIDGNPFQISDGKLVLKVIAEAVEVVM